MRTEKYIHSLNSAIPFHSASGLLDPWTTEQINDEVVTIVLEEEKKRRYNAEKPPAGGPDSLPEARPATLRKRAPHRWGVVLAGGDGVRMRELTRWVYGDDRPKQFCSLLGNRTLLEDAWLRAERSIPREQILFCVTRSHRSHYRRCLPDGPSQRIVQPFNKGTAPAIICALRRIAQADPDAIVSILPSDHYYSSESAFTAALESAMKIAEQRTEFVVLLGAQPTYAEVEYGWIETGESLGGGCCGLFRVEAFQEKPSADRARALMRSGALWNTFVMVGHVDAFVEMAWATVPRLMETLESMEMEAGPGSEVRIPESVYGQIPSTDFSRGVLALARRSLLAFRLDNSDWNDLGDPYRVLATLVEKEGELPPWARLWPAAQANPGTFRAAA